MDRLLGYDKKYLKDINGYLTAKEIMQQPRLWQETLEIVKRNKGEINAFLAKVLSREDLRIIFAGAGSSAFIGDSVVPYLNKKIPQNIEAIPTTDIVTNPGNYLFPNKPTLLVSFARSGNSPESVATVELAEQIVDELYQIVITCNPEGELAKRTFGAENNLLLLMPEDSNDQAFAMTGSFTSMALASLLIFELGNLKTIEADTKLMIEHGKQVLDKNISKIKEIVLNDFNRTIFLGSSCLKGLAKESFIKSLELTRGEVMTNFDSSLGFRHGPKTVINDQTLIFSYLSNDKYARQYEIDLLKEFAAESGNRKIIAVSAYPDREVESLVDYFLCISDAEQQFGDDVYLIFNYVLIAQMFALFKSIQLGITPDNPCPEGNVNRVVKGVTIYPYS